MRLICMAVLSALFVPLLLPAQQPSQPDRIRVGGNVQAANLIKKVTPVYPPLAKQARVQGTVRCTVTIAKDGHVENIQLISGHPLLVPAAVSALQEWVYKPTLLNGEPVTVVTSVDINFTLSEDWAVTWNFLAQFRLSGEDAGTAALLGGAKLLADGRLQSADTRLSSWRFKELRLDDGASFEPAIYAAPSRSNEKLPEIVGNWRVMEPRLVSRREPVKPREDAHGTVDLDCVISADGNVEKVLMIQGTATDELKQIATEAVRDWKFRPLSVNGQYYPVRTTIRIEF